MTDPNLINDAFKAFMTEAPDHAKTWGDPSISMHLPLVPVERGTLLLPSLGAHLALTKHPSSDKQNQ
jgi:hypothetical protein